MSESDRTYLKAILEADRLKRFSELPEDEHFEVFAAEQVTKRFAIDSDENQSAVTKGNRDGGIDAMYFFVDRRLIREDPEIKELQRRGVSVDLVIVQATRTAGFGEDALHKLLATINDLLDLSKKDKDIAKVARAYNSRVLEIVTRFRAAYMGLLSYSPTLTITCYYVSQGDSIDVNVQRKADNLVERLQVLYSAATCTFHFVGAKELLTLYNQQSPRTLTIQV